MSDLSDADRESRANEIYRRLTSGLRKPFSCWNARALMASYKSFGMFRHADRIVDVGCARADICLAIPPSCEYIGIDIHRDTLHAARAIFDEQRFLYLDVREPKYNPNNGCKAKDAVLPVSDEWANNVIARSLFTHFESIDGVSQYLGECRRILQSQGLLYVTWFREPPNERCSDQRRRVFHEQGIRRVLDNLGLLVIHEFGGRTDQREDQWHMVCKKSKEN